MSDLKMEEILKRLEKVEKEAQLSKDWIAISNLHGRYNHLLIGHHWETIVDEMFAKKTPGVTSEIVESGVFYGIEGAKKVFIEMLGKLYNYDGNLAYHTITTPYIIFSEDGQKARGCWLHLGANTFYDPVKKTIAVWQAIRYDHTFVKEDGEWKFLHYKANLVFRSSYDKGWVKEPVIQGSTIKGPDESLAVKSDAPTSFHNPYDPTVAWGYDWPLPPTKVE
jgi:hypothetical protein